MPIDILMPALSPTMEQGKLAKWLKAEGDKIKAGDIIAEIETDKATMAVEAVDEGTLAKILIADGTENVAVNTLIGLIAADGEDVSAAASGSAKAAPAPQAAEKPAEPAKAAELMMWSIACMAKLKVMNSTIGFRPVSAAPTPMPAKPCSVIGVSMTRRAPNSCSRPCVTL